MLNKEMLAGKKTNIIVIAVAAAAAFLYFRGDEEMAALLGAGGGLGAAIRAAVRKVEDALSNLSESVEILKSEVSDLRDG